MTSPDDPREIAFWLDAAMLSLASYASAKQAGDTAATNANAKTLVSVSCEYNAAWHDARAAETFAQLDARLQQLADNPDALRRAFRAAPKSPLWDSGEYAKLLADAGPAQQN